MKNKGYKILLIISFIFSLFFITSCKNNNIKFDNDIDVYTDYSFGKNGIYFACDYDYEEYDDHVLQLYFDLKIGNAKNHKVNLEIKDPIAYGNDTKLEEKVLSSYDHNDKSLTKEFTNKELVLDKKNKANLGIRQISFELVIKDGNPECKYRIDFKFNNVNLSVYSYKKDYETSKFMYVHNPSYQRAVLADAEYDMNAVFGYKPSASGSLAQFAGYDWTNEEAVLGYKEERIKYISENDERIKTLENDLRSQNKSIEEIARECSTLRNQIRLEQYKDDPEGLALLKERNLSKYGHEEGPLPDELYQKYGSWEMVLEKCYSVNRGMDACCGVYDMYFYLYNDFAY